MISRETIDEVKNRMDIVDIIGEFVSLKRSGQNYKALSPFTNEKTASFYVVPAKGIFKDFSSGKGGDGITFVMEHEGMSYMETIRYLAKKYGVDLKEEVSTPEVLASQNTRDSLYILMNYAKDYYRSLLLDHDEGRSVGLSYFRERGFNDRTIEKFELGYSLNSWDHLIRKATSDGHSEDMLDKAGLMVRKDDGKKYDRFRGRVIFPVHNLSGKVIAFGARMLTKEKDQPKYINSPETEIYHKSNVLYGLYQGKNAIRREDFCYLVEGYTDVISLHQSDIDNVVASSGTALTEEQIKLMRRFTENVTVLYDGDAAGIKAALRGIDLVLKGGLNVRIVLLPDGEDPDSFSKKMGSTDLKKYLKDHTKDFISFKIDLYLKDFVNDPLKKSELIKDILYSISLIPDPLKRMIYLQECSVKVDMPLSSLITEVNKNLIKVKQSSKHAQSDEKSPENPSQSISRLHSLSKSLLTTPEEMLKPFETEYIKVLINRGYKELLDLDIKNGFYHEFEYLFTETQEVDFIDKMNSEIDEFYKFEVAKGNIVAPDVFIRLVSDNLSRYVADLLVQRYFVSPGWKVHNIVIDDEYNKDSLKRVTLKWKLGFIQKMLQDNLAKLRLASNQEEIDNLLEIQFRIDEYKNTYARALGMVVLPFSKFREL